MDSWNLENITRTYLYLAVIPSIFFLFMCANVGDVSNDNIIEDKIDYNNLYTIHSVMAFLAGFGVVGFILLKFIIHSVAVTTVISLIFAVPCMFLGAYVLSKLRYKKKLEIEDIKKLVGKVGKVQQILYPNSEGEIEINEDGKVFKQRVVNITDTEIEVFEQVKIIKMEQNILYVDRV